MCCKVLLTSSYFAQFCVFFIQTKTQFYCKLFQLFLFSEIVRENFITCKQNVHDNDLNLKILFYAHVYFTCVIKNIT